MAGDAMSLVLYLQPEKDFGELWFFKVDFSTNTSTGVKLYSEYVDSMPYTLFMGASSVAAQGVTIYQSYTVGSLQMFETGSGVIDMSKFFGAVLPSIPGGCMKDNTSEATLSVPVFTESVTWKAEEREMEDS